MFKCTWEAIMNNMSYVYWNREVLNGTKECLDNSKLPLDQENKILLKCEKDNKEIID